MKNKGKNYKTQGKKISLHQKKEIREIIPIEERNNTINYKKEKRNYDKQNKIKINNLKSNKDVSIIDVLITTQLAT